MNAPDALHARRAPDRDINDAAAGALREQAIEAIADRIKAGKHRLSIKDLLDCELQGERYTLTLGEVSQILTCDYHDRSIYIDKLHDGLIERYIGTHGDEVEIEADDIEAHAEEDAYVDEAMARAEEEA